MEDHTARVEDQTARVEDQTATVKDQTARVDWSHCCWLEIVLGNWLADSTRKEFFADKM